MRSHMTSNFARLLANSARRNGIKLFRAHLIGSVAVFAIGSGAANAQDGATESVVVSASRITIAGYQQPTPVTVVGVAQMERDANPDIGDTIRQLPSLGGSSGPNNGVNTNALAAGNAGEDLVNLRNLGILRTLVLVDGQRIVQSNITGGVDLSTIPSSIVQRIDVVTGGASAAWGSDAVAGVVNLVLDKNFEGFKANLQAGDDHLDIRQQWKAEAAWGGSFFGDRLHLIASGQYSAAPDTVHPNQESWFNDTEILANPAHTATNGQPRLIHADNVGFSTATLGGVIVSNPAGTVPGSANVLKNIQFVGPTGTPVPFYPGNVSGLECSGCSSDHITADLAQMVAEYNNATAFLYGSYKITPDIQASLQFNYGKTDVLATAAPAEKFGTVTIHSDNAFLNPTIAATMAANGIPYFMLGTTNENNLTAVTADSMLAQQASLGRPVDHTNRQMYRGVFTLEGALGEDWLWNAYLQHGESRLRLISISNLVTANFNNAVDSVVVTAANRGSSGLGIGSIACRSTLTAPTNGCVPLDLFGEGVASTAAIAYVNKQNDFEEVILNEDVASASLQGTLPWGLPAGRIAVAGGGEARRETGVATTTPEAVAVAYTVGNFSPFKGAYNVYEGFTEIDAPLLKDNIVQSLDFSAAGRLTDYSTSGLVETWKMGLTSQVNDDIRLRGTWSYDIRAPNLSELFASGASTSAAGVDPHSHLTVNYFTVSIGNKDLTPEQSTTISGGVVLTPSWIEGLSLSLDYYSISIKNAIYSAGGSTILAQCAAGVAAYCSAVKFDGPGGALSQVYVEPLNTASAATSGLDFQADYQHDLFAGTLQLRAIANYMDEQTQTTLGVETDYAGALGGDSLVTGGVPKFKGTVAATYLEGPWQATVQSRLIGSARLVNGWTPADIDDNSIPFVAYMDLRGSYKWNDSMQFYAAVDNFWDTPPPVVATSSIVSGSLGVAVRSDIYDVIGRQYRIGVRFAY